MLYHINNKNLLFKIMDYSISLYIPVFNAEKTIGMVIDGVKKQSLAPSEIIVVNDASTDRTVNIVSDYKDIKLITLTEEKGIAYSRNIAISNCKNDFIASLDHDVLPDKDWLKNMMDSMIKNKSSYCGGKMIEKYIKNSFNSWRAKRYKQNWGDNDLINPPFVFGCNTLQLKNTWEKIGGYEEKYITNGEDVNYSKKIRSQNLITNYSVKALTHHLQNDNLTSLSNRVWRYHTYSYKIEKPSYIRFFRLVIKQFKFLIGRFLNDLIKLKFNFLIIDLIVFIQFIRLELQRTRKEKNK